MVFSAAAMLTVYISSLLRTVSISIARRTHIQLHELENCGGTWPLNEVGRDCG